VTGIVAAVSGFGLETVPEPLPTAVQPVAQLVYRCFRKTPGAPRVFFVHISRSRHWFSLIILQLIDLLIKY